MRLPLSSPKNIASERFEATTVYGIYKSFDIVLSYFDYSDCELELEGLT